MQVEKCCQALLETLLPVIDPKKEGFCIDIGVGTFAFYCQQFAQQGFKTIAVEPLPVKQLKEVCRQHKITLIESCCSDVSGWQTLHIGQDLNLNSIMSDWWGVSSKTKKVKSKTLHEILAETNVQKITCIKIDIEGAESLVISQFLELPDSLLPQVVMFEYGGGAMKQSGKGGWLPKYVEATKKCLKILKQCGYDFSIIIDGTKVANESIFNLQSCDLDADTIFHSQANWGNIITFRDFKYPTTEVAKICKPYSSNPQGKDLINETRVPIAEVKFRKIPDRENARQNPALFKKTGESHVISKFIQSNSIVFDVGASVGNWTQEVLAHHPNAEIHIFEPRLPAYRNLIQNLSTEIQLGKIIANNFAVATSEEIKTFYDYENNPELSTFYRRFNAEKPHNIQPPQEISILTTSIDSYCKRLGIKRVNFIKIDVEGSEVDVLHGCSKLLQQGKIDYIQFEYGGTYIDSQTTLKEVFSYLQSCRYLIFKILSNKIEYIPQFLHEHEDFRYSNFLAVNERFKVNILGGKRGQMLDLVNLSREHFITPRGVIHIGAHMGQELGQYQAMNIPKILFVEANPIVAKRLEKQVENLPYVQVVNCAISDENGSVNLHLTANEQSSSILPLKEVTNIYPSITETDRITVEAKRLDQLLEDLKLNLAEYNLLNIDIQGAELLALQGATNLLKYVDAINTEVNYEELYEGCALIDEIDEFLDQHGFERVATTTPHPTWGDAFYRRKPVVTVSILGRHGRFANQIFQYAFLKVYAFKHDLRAETPNWIGEYLFGCKDAKISNSQSLRVVTEKMDQVTGSRYIPNLDKPFKNVDFKGYFQFHSRYYSPYKDYFRSLFQPVGEVASTITLAMNKLRVQGKTIVGLHLRRGDYKDLMWEKRPGITYVYTAPHQWYKDWLASFWETLDEPVLFIASDEIEEVVGDFADYNPITVKDLGVELPQTPYYPDFYILSQCDILAISNSSFSFAASMLNERGKFFFRPHFKAQQLIPYDPWNSEPLLWWKQEEIDFQAFLPDNDLIEIVDVIWFVETASKYLHGFAFDSPTKETKANAASFLVSGWVLGKTSPPKVVELVSNGKVFQKITFNNPRADVARVYARISATQDCGYAAFLNSSKLLKYGEFIIQVVLQDENTVPIAKVVFKKIPLQSTNSHLQKSHDTLKQLQSRLQRLQPE